MKKVKTATGFNLPTATLYSCLKRQLEPAKRELVRGGGTDRVMEDKETLPFLKVLIKQGDGSKSCLSIWERLERDRQPLG